MANLKQTTHEITLNSRIHKRNKQQLLEKCHARISGLRDDVYVGRTRITESSFRLF